MSRIIIAHIAAPHPPPASTAASSTGHSGAPTPLHFPMPPLSSLGIDPKQFHLPPAPPTYNPSAFTPIQPPSSGVMTPAFPPPPMSTGQQRECLLCYFTLTFTASGYATMSAMTSGGYSHAPYPAQMQAPPSQPQQNPYFMPPQQPQFYQMPPPPPTAFAQRQASPTVAP